MAINFYGGQPGRSFRIERIFDTVKGDTNSLEYDLKNTHSDITLGSYVLVSYGQVGSDRYKECLAIDGTNYNGSIWVKDYNVEDAKEPCSVEGNAIKYWMLTQAMGVTGAAAGFGAVTATVVDDGPGTPEAHIAISGPETAKNFAFTFNHLEGKVGQAAGFGTPTASIEDKIPGTPSVDISASGADTAKVFDFKFHHLKGEQGYSINNIAKTGTDVLEDTYTVYRNDASSPVVGTFVVTNGDGIVKSELLEDYKLKLTYDSGKEVTIGPIRGAQGKPFTIDVRYSSIAEMQADFSHRTKGDYAMIQTSVEEPDNAKLYYRDDTEWVFMGDFSGATGIKGDTGAAAGFGSVTATVGETDPGTPSVNVETSGLDTAKNFAFTFNHIKGQKGDTGSTYVPNVSDSGDLSWVKEDNPTAAPETKNIRGPQGIQGNQGYSIATVEKQSSAGLIDTYNVKINNPSSSSVGTFTVTNGIDGVDADIVKTEYALSATQVQPTTGWSETIPVLIPGYYLWTRITWVNDDITYLVARQGLDGTGTGDMQAADYDKNNLVISAGGIQEYIASHIEVDEENDMLVFNFGQS